MTPAAVFTIAVITGLVGLAIGAPKGHPVWGFFLGFLLSVIGLVVIICTRPTHEAQVRKATARLAAENEARHRVENL